MFSLFISVTGGSKGRALIEYAPPEEISKHPNLELAPARSQMKQDGKPDGLITKVKSVLYGHSFGRPVFKTNIFLNVLF